MKTYFFTFLFCLIFFGCYVKTSAKAVCNVDDPPQTREVLLAFFNFSGEGGNVIDGYTIRNTSFIIYNFIQSESMQEFVTHKNTVEIDQRFSLIQSIGKYIDATAKRSILNEEITRHTVQQGMANVKPFLLNERYNDIYRLL